MPPGNILLISANTEVNPLPVYPLALARLACALERAGHRAVQFDIQTQGPEALPRVLRDCGPDLVGVSMRNIDNVDCGRTRCYVDDYTRLVRTIRTHTRAPIVVGGSGFSLFARELMQVLDVDFGVVGPGEAPLCALVAALDGGRDAAQAQRIPGLLTRDTATPLEQACEPFVPAETHRPELVQHYWQAAGMIGIQTKRGCPRACVYCSYPLIEGRGVCCAEPGLVVDEMERLFTDFGIDYFFVVDSVFNLSEAHEIAFADEICRRSLRVGSTRVNWDAFFAPTPMTREYIERLRASGLQHMEFGTDSLSESMLAAYRKPFSVDDVVRTADLCTRAGVYCAHYLLLGGPGETPETLRETVRNSKRLRDNVFLPLAGLRIVPNTELFEIARADGQLTPDADILTPCFYLAPGLTADRIWHIVEDDLDSRRGWMLPDVCEHMPRVMRRMRGHGTKGPLWEHLLAW